MKKDFGVSKNIVQHYSGVKKSGSKKRSESGYWGKDEVRRRHGIRKYAAENGRN